MLEGTLVHTINDVYRLHLPLVWVKGLADRDTGSNNNGVFSSFRHIQGPQSCQGPASSMCEIHHK